MNESLNIIFVCYNCGDDIVLVLEDIKNGQYPTKNLNIVIVDNASSDNSIKSLEKVTDLKITIIASDTNLGFGSGCNRAMQHLMKGKTLLLNPDVRLMKDSISNLVSYSNENPEALIWGGKTVGIDGLEDGKNAWKEPSLLGVICWSFFGDIILKKIGRTIPDAYSSYELNKTECVDAISGCFFLIDTKLFKNLGGFDERFFMYSEEVDLCRRARENGARPKSTSTAVIVHEGSKTITSQNKLDFLYHSKLKYCKKHWTYAGFLLARLSILSGSILRCGIFTLQSFNKKQNKREAAIWRTFIKQQILWKL
jgi:GT2 family glycosyltransferase